MCYQEVSVIVCETFITILKIRIFLPSLFSYLIRIWWREDNWCHFKLAQVWSPSLIFLFCYRGSIVRFFQLFNLNRWFILVFLLREQERYLLRIQELEIAVARLGEESIDKATLLETAQSDKETISRSALKLLGPLHF